QPAVDGRACCIWRAGDRCRLVNHFGGDRHDHGAASDRIPVVPAAVRAILHAGGHSLMRLLTWNIQYGKGCDGVTDLARIVSVAKSFADADVFCFQEVSANFPKLDKGTDQSVALAALLPDYRPIFGPAIETVDNEGRAHRFGNMTLSRLPVLQIASHLLPWLRTGVSRSMRR